MHHFDQITEDYEITLDFYEMRNVSFEKIITPPPAKNMNISLIETVIGSFPSFPSSTNEIKIQIKLD